MNQIISDDSFHSLYNLFDNFEEFRTFINVGDGFVNINTSNDYINLTKDDKKLVLKRCLTIISQDIFFKNLKKIFVPRQKGFKNINF